MCTSGSLLWDDTWPSGDAPDPPEDAEPEHRLEVPCPTCGALGVIPIVFGLPGPELVEESRRGRVVLPG